MTKKQLEKWLDAAKHCNYAECEIVWLDDKKGGKATIKLNNEMIEDEDDTLIFYCCANVQEFAELFDPDNGEDFYITDVYDVY